MRNEIHDFVGRGEQSMARILVIDDDDHVRTMLRLTLEQAGYEILDAPNGKVGIDIYRESPTDLIITDLIMPEKEGVETIQELRRDYPAVKIIAISGGGRVSPEEYLPLAEMFGAQRVFSKPFGRDDLLQAIQELTESDQPGKGDEKQTQGPSNTSRHTRSL